MTLLPCNLHFLLSLYICFACSLICMVTEVLPRGSLPLVRTNVIVEAQPAFPMFVRSPPAPSYRYRSFPTFFHFSISPPFYPLVPLLLRPALPSLLSFPFIFLCIFLSHSLKSISFTSFLSVSPFLSLTFLLSPTLSPSRLFLLHSLSLVSPSLFHYIVKRY